MTLNLSQEVSRWAKTFTTKQIWNNSKHIRADALGIASNLNNIVAGLYLASSPQAFIFCGWGGEGGVAPQNTKVQQLQSLHPGTPQHKCLQLQAGRVTSSNRRQCSQGPVCVQGLWHSRQCKHNTYISIAIWAGTGSRWQLKAVASTSNPKLQARN